MKYVLLALLLMATPALADENDTPEARMVEVKGKNGNLSHPILMGHERFTEQESINVLILDEVATWNCDGAPDLDKATKKPHFNAVSTIRLFDKKFLSYTVDLDYYCGGPAPNKQMEARNYDLETGTAIPLSEIFKPTFYNEDNQKDLTHTLLEGHKPKPACAASYSDDMKWDYYMTEKNMVFFPHIPDKKECVEEFPMPYAELQSVMYQANSLIGY